MTLQDLGVNPAAAGSTAPDNVIHLVVDGFNPTDGVAEGEFCDASGGPLGHAAGNSQAGLSAPPQTSLKDALLASAAYGPMPGVGGKTQDEQVADALVKLSPIQEKCQGLLHEVERTRKALYKEIVNGTIVCNSIPEYIFAIIVKSVTGREYDPNNKYSDRARVLFGIVNEPIIDAESRRRNQAKNSITYKLANGLRRTDKATKTLELSGEPATADEVLQLLCQPGSGGLRGSADLVDSSEFYDNAETDNAGQAYDGTESKRSGDTEPDEDTDESDDDNDNEYGDTNTETGTNTGSDTKGADKTDKKAKDKGVSKADRDKLLKLPDLSLDDISARFTATDDIFHVLFKKTASGSLVPLAYAPITAAIIKPFLPTVSASNADSASMFIVEALVLAHSVIFKAYATIHWPAVVLAGNGKLVRFAIAFAGSQGSVMMSGMPANNVVLSFTGYGTIKQYPTDIKPLSLKGRFKKGGGTVSVAAPKQSGDLAILYLGASDIPPVTLNVTKYRIDGFRSELVGELNPDAVNLDVRMPDSHADAAKLWDRLKSIVGNPSPCSEYVIVAHRDQTLVGFKATHENGVGWGAGGDDEGMEVFFTDLGDIVHAVKAVNRLNSKSVPTIAADSRGLLVFTVSTEVGTYSIAIPGLYPNTSTRRTDFSRPFAPIAGIEIAGETSENQGDELEEDDDSDDADDPEDDGSDNASGADDDQS